MCRQYKTNLQSKFSEKSISRSPGASSRLTVTNTKTSWYIRCFSHKTHALLPSRTGNVRSISLFCRKRIRVRVEKLLGVSWGSCAQISFCRRFISFSKQTFLPRLIDQTKFPFYLLLNVNHLYLFLPSYYFFFIFITKIKIDLYLYFKQN